jgi:hypothetical protein
MFSAPPHNANTYVRDIDSMARAVFTWVRQQSMEQRFLGVPVSEAEQSELAAGFIAGLRARLGLADSESILVAYVFALMRGERSAAANIAQNLLNREPGAAVSCAGYLHGLSAARRILGEQHSLRETSDLTDGLNSATTSPSTLN